MQVCSSLHFVRVYVRRVIHVIVHSGLTVVEGVLVVLHTYVAGGIVFTPPVHLLKSFVSELLYQEVLYLHKQGEFIFPIADGRIKTPGGDQELRTSTVVRHRPIQGDSHIDFLGESEGSFPQPHDSLPVASEAMNDFWSMSGSFLYRHHVEPRVKLYSPRIIPYSTEIH